MVVWEKEQRTVFLIKDAESLETANKMIQLFLIKGTLTKETGRQM